MSRAAPARRRVRLESDDRQEQIIAAARTLFGERSYEEVSTSDIAHAAGTTRTNVLYHFASKRQLFLVALGRFATVPPQIGYIRGDTVAERVDSLFEHWLGSIERNREAYVAMLRARTSSDAEVAGLLAGSMRAWERQLTTAVGLNPDDPVHLVTVQCYQALITAATEAWLERGFITREHVHAMLTDAFAALGESATSGPRRILRQPTADDGRDS
ncbi:TetR/AcrR family transcriptional regulator [Gordonia shandongensis]|uniref:TetR/AcrR family transcriptional regulator n=1 Tax=Gordonia shandongensis TaxID=376351 RepID=UPI0004129962|nr:TetR/AcrR family transcriptional regulator [Gordonia shandongensis]